MTQNNKPLAASMRILSETDLSLVQGGIGMASTAAKPLIPVIIAVVEKYLKDHPQPPAT